MPLHGLHPPARYTMPQADRKSTRLNSSHGYISYAVFCLKKKNHVNRTFPSQDGHWRNRRVSIMLLGSSEVQELGMLVVVALSAESLPGGYRQCGPYHYGD